MKTASKKTNPAPTSGNTVKTAAAKKSVKKTAMKTMKQLDPKNDLTCCACGSPHGEFCENPWTDPSLMRGYPLSVPTQAQFLASVEPLREKLVAEVEASVAALVLAPTLVDRSGLEFARAI